MKGSLGHFGRPLGVAAIAAAILSACGVFQTWREEGCDLQPVGEEQASKFRIGPAVALALCATSVEVEGRIYTVGVGRWLDEESLSLTEYALVTRAVGPVADPQTYSLDGVDPLQMLVMNAAEGAADDLGPMGPFMVLWGDTSAVPKEMCAYADAMDAQYPGDQCPLQQGRTYGPVEMIIACGFEVPMGPYGGVYWRVVDLAAEPPTGSPYTGMSRDLDYGTVELMDDGTMTYVSELGAELTLERDRDSEAAIKVCPRPDGY